MRLLHLLSALAICLLLPACEQLDAPQSLQALADKFPPENHRADGKTDSLSNVATHVEHLDTPATPGEGFIEFSSQWSSRLRLVFQWQHERWIFMRGYDREANDAPLDPSFLQGKELAAFLERATPAK